MMVNEDFLSSEYHKYEDEDFLDNVNSIDDSDSIDDINSKIETIEPDICYQFEFIGTTSGFGIVYARNKEEAIEKIKNGDIDDIIDTFGIEVTDVTNIEKI